MRQTDTHNKYVPPSLTGEQTNMLAEFAANYPTDNPKLFVRLITEAEFRKLAPGSEVYDVNAKKSVVVDDPSAFEITMFMFGHVMFGELHEEFQTVKLVQARKTARKADHGLAEISNMITAFSKGRLPS